MRARIRKLRKQSIAARPYISPERAILLTEFYESGIANQPSIPVERALAFKHLLENKKICINEGELIVGERGSAPKEAPTYPEICCHTLKDLETLNSRKKIPYAVDEATKKVYKEKIIPFWKGRSIRDAIFTRMSDEWKAAYEAGVFTEFLEQRAPGHTALDDKIYKKGLVDFKKDITRSMQNLDFLTDADACKKQEELKAMEIAADALILYAERHADLARNLARKERNTERRRELERIADVCTRVPSHAPRDFWEALQYYWFVHLGVITELNPWDAFNPGRLDQHLFPFYEKGLADGTLTKEDARELLRHFG
jgi:formate C-acetyltransferase